MDTGWFGSRWLKPTEGSWLERFAAGERRTRWRPGSFLCGLRADGPGVTGLSSEWRYRMSSVDGDVLVFGRQRLDLRLTQLEPIEAWVEPRTGFLVWSAVDLGSGRPVELAVERRDGYLVAGLPLQVPSESDSDE